MNFIELRSDEVQEILGSPPRWLVRWGTTVVLTGFLLMVFAAWFVRYPDIIQAQVVIGTIVPPVDIVARADGRIMHLLIRDRQEVQTNDLVGVLQSAANYSHVLQIDMASDAWQKSKLDSFRLINAPDNLELGELQNAYAEFLQQLENFKFGKENRSTSYRSNIGSIQQQIIQLEQSINFDQKALKRINEQFKTAEEMYQAQKKLFDEGLTSRVEFEKERVKLADLERDREIYDQNILRKRNDIISLRNGINNASLGQQENSSGNSSRLQSSLSNLRSSIDKWKQTYLFFAPIAGRVSLTNIAEQQYVKAGEQIMTIVPPMSDKVVGRVMLPIAGSGKGNYPI